MKKKKMLDMMNLADDRFIGEAAPRVRKKRTNWRRFALVAACICLMLTGVNLLLFLPYSTTPPDVSAYRSSDYYPLIEKLNVYTYEAPKYKNNFDKWTNAIEDMFLAGSGTSEPVFAPGAPSPDGEMNNGTAEGTGKYEEVTDNQVAGVIEADLIKRSDEYIYYMSRDGYLYVYAIDGENSKWLNSIRISNYPKESFSGMYLSEDCKTIIAIGSLEGNTVLHTVAVNGSVLQREKTVTVTGRHSSSRMINGELLLLTKHTVYKKDIDFSQEESYLPQITVEDESHSISADNIYAPDKISNLQYTVIYKLDGKTLAEKDTAAFLSYSDIFYVNKTHIYATHRYTETTDSKSWRTSEVKTEIICISYTGEKFTPVGSVTLNGFLHDQYSMDEYNGVLRVVTSTDKDSWQTGPWHGSFGDLPEELHGERSANLYCIDLSTWEIAGKVIGFAPQGEQVESVRFDGDSAYVCTAVVVTMTDPVFFFDLSDLNNITYKDTGVIEGYSSSLVNFAPGYLLGIGQVDRNTLKIEVYEESERGVVSVEKFEMFAEGYATDYKAYYIDRENGLIGFAAYSYGDSLFEEAYNPCRYIVLQWENEQLIEVLNVGIHCSPNDARGFYADGYYYVPDRVSLAAQPLSSKDISLTGEMPTQVDVISSHGQQYTFTSDAAGKVADYLSGLSLEWLFDDTPDHYNGTTWTIMLSYEDGKQIILYHRAEAFIRREDGDWYKIVWHNGVPMYFSNFLTELQDSITS